MPKGGRYFFQVQVIRGVLLKIGVSKAGANPDKVRKSSIKLQAFCDTDEGWGMYNGELRHASNQQGSKYGEPLKEGDVVGVMLDSIAGELGFVRNGHCWGVAFKDTRLCQDLYASVAAIYKDDSFALRHPCAED